MNRCMVLITIVLLFSCAVFICALISPDIGTRVQIKSQKLLKLFLDKVSHLPRIPRFIISRPPIASHKTVHKSASVGKKTHKKIRNVGKS
jgi:hypothetical protein